MTPSGIIGMLGNLGFPAPSFFGWLLLLSEIVFGISVLIGWKLKYTVWPLVIVLLVALIMVTLPNIKQDQINVLFHLLGIAGLISLYLTGPGAFSLKGKKAEPVAKVEPVQK